MKELRTSETRIIYRSQINLNPINPKRHSDEVVKLQKKNLQKMGYLGGVVWNERTGNLVDGHRRILAMDLYYKYDATPQTDYQIKVEVVALDEKTEKEQLTYMAVGNTKADIDLIARYIGDIDLNDIGLSSNEIDEIMAFNSNLNITIDTFDDMLATTEDTEPAEDAKHDTTNEGLSYEDRTAQMKALKQQVKEQAIERQKQEESYIVVSFSNYTTKEDFCDLVGIGTDEKFIKGEDLIKYLG